MNKLVELDGKANVSYIYLADYINNKYNYQDILKVILGNQNIIMSFPIYIDTIPSILLELLNNIENYIKSNNIENEKLPRIYAISNCRYYDGKKNELAFEVLKNFCYKNNFIWRFGIGVAVGSMVVNSDKLIPLKSPLKYKIYHGLRYILEDVDNNDLKKIDNIYFTLKLPKMLIMYIANNYWKKHVKI